MIYVAGFTGSIHFIDALPTAGAVGYEYIVGFADWVSAFRIAPY